MPQPLVYNVVCVSCGERYSAKRVDSRFCGSTCRVRASRARASLRSVLGA